MVVKKPKFHMVYLIMMDSKWISYRSRVPFSSPKFNSGSSRIWGFVRFDHSARIRGLVIISIERDLLLMNKYVCTWFYVHCLHPTLQINIKIQNLQEIAVPNQHVQVTNVCFCCIYCGWLQSFTDGLGLVIQGAIYLPINLKVSVCAINLTARLGHHWY